MSKTLFSTYINKTALQIIRGDITTVKVDAIVSSDDVYLSRGGGVSGAISKQAGENLNHDIRKQPLPIQLGNVIVTSAGNLPARYVLHAITVGYGYRSMSYDLIPILISKILNIASSLEMVNIAVPLLGAGNAHLTPKLVFKSIIQNILYQLASGDFEIETVVVVLFDPIDITAELKTLRNLAERADEIQELVERIKTLVGLLDSADEYLIDSLTQKLKVLKDDFQKLFDDTKLDGNEPISQNDTPKPLNDDQARAQLKENIERLDKQLKRELRLKSIEENYLKIQQENQKVSPNEDLEFKIKASLRRLEDVERDINSIIRQKKQYQEESEILREELNTYRSSLFDIFVERFNISEIKTFCFHLSIDYERFPHDSKEALIRQLLIHLVTHRKMQLASEIGHKIRPDIEWPASPYKNLEENLTSS